MDKESCKNCRFFSLTSETKTRVHGSCHRYPILEHVMGGHWCGEWKPKMLTEDL